MAPSRIPYSFHDSWLYACINHAAIVHAGKEVKAAVAEPGRTEPGRQRIGGKGCRTQRAIVQNRQFHHDFLTKLPILRAWRRASGRGGHRTRNSRMHCKRRPESRISGRLVRFSARTCPLCTIRGGSFPRTTGAEGARTPHAPRTHPASAHPAGAPKVSDGKRCGWLGRARFIMGCASIYPKDATPLCKGGSLCSVSESSIWARTPFG